MKMFKLTQIIFNGQALTRGDNKEKSSILLEN